MTKKLFSGISVILMAMMIFVAGNVFALGRTYTLDVDFDEGVMVGVQHDDPAHDQLQLSKEQHVLPFIWVASSGESTVSKIDTVTGVELGRYRTGPLGGFGENPSRTTVDLNGDVWVGNRNSNTAVKIALNPTDTRGAETGNPSIFIPADVAPDGLLNTSTGPGDVLSWGDDDAVLMRITADFGPRALAIDASNNVWIGGVGQDMEYFNGQTGILIKGIDIGRICYGALIDGNGTLWVANQGAGMTRIDNPSGAHTVSFISTPYLGWVYGLGIDQDGYIYCSGWSYNRISKYDPNANLWVWSQTISGGSNGRGVCVGLDGDVWVANSGLSRVTRHDPSNGNLIATVIVGSTPTGVATDAAGKIWVTNYGSNSVMRIDPATNLVDFTQAGHPSPYNYSDMTGIISRTITTKTGTWTVDYDSGIPGVLWGMVSWNGEPQGFEPAGTSITVRARSSVDGSTWSAWEVVVNGVPLSSTPPGQYLQVESTLKILTGDVSPVLADLTVEPSLIIVAVDIHPTSCPNPLNVKSKGVIPVAILGAVDFDVTQINPASVRLEGVAPLRWALEDVAAPYLPLLGKQGAYACTTDGPDGFLDLTLKFDAQEVVSALGLVNDGDILILSLTGELINGTPIMGEDIVKIIKKGKPAPAGVMVFSAEAPFPNPCNPETWIPYKLASDVEVEIRIYDLAGRLIRMLDIGQQSAGFYTVKEKAAYWDGRNKSGEKVASGIYFYRIQAGDFSAMRKIIVAR